MASCTFQGIPAMLQREEPAAGCNADNDNTKPTSTEVGRRLFTSVLKANGIVKEGQTHSTSRCMKKKKLMPSCTTPSSSSESTKSLLQLVVDVLRWGTNEQSNIAAPRPPDGPPTHHGRQIQVHSSIPYREIKARLLAKKTKYNGIGNTVQTGNSLSNTEVVCSTANEVHPYYSLSYGENMEDAALSLGHASLILHTLLNESLGGKVLQSRVSSDGSSVFCTAPVAAAASSDLKISKEVLKKRFPQGICEEPLVGLLLDACSDENGTIAIGDALSFFKSQEEITGDDKVIRVHRLSVINSDARLRAYFRVFILIGARQYSVDDKMRITTLFPSSEKVTATTTTTTKKRRTIRERIGRGKVESASVSADSPWLLLAERLFQKLSSFPRHLLYTTAPLGEERTPPLEWSDRWDSWTASPSALRQLPIQQVWPLIMFPRFVVMMMRWGRRPMDLLRELQMTSVSSKSGSVCSLATTISNGGGVLSDVSRKYSMSSQHPYYKEDRDTAGKQVGSGVANGVNSNGSNNNDKKNVLANSDTPRVGVRDRARDSLRHINSLLNLWEKESANDTLQSHSAGSPHASENSSPRSQWRRNTPVTNRVRYNGKTTSTKPPTTTMQRHRREKAERLRVSTRARGGEFSPYTGSTFRRSTYSFFFSDTTAAAEMRKKRGGRIGEKANQDYRKKESNCFFAAELYSAVRPGHQIGDYSLRNLRPHVEETGALRVNSHTRAGSCLSFFLSSQAFPSSTELSDLACDILKRARGERHLAQVIPPGNHHHHYQQHEQEEQEVQQQQQKEHGGEGEEEERHHYGSQEGGSRTVVTLIPCARPMDNDVSACNREFGESTSAHQPDEMLLSNKITEVLNGMGDETLPHAIEESEEINWAPNSANPIFSLKGRQDDVPFTLAADTMMNPCSVQLAIGLEGSNCEVPCGTRVNSTSSASCSSVKGKVVVENDEIEYQQRELNAPISPVYGSTALLPMKVHEDAAGEGFVEMRRPNTEVIFPRSIVSSFHHALGSQKSLQRCRSAFSMIIVEPPPHPQYKQNDVVRAASVSFAADETTMFGDPRRASSKGTSVQRNVRSVVKEKKRMGYFCIVLLLQRVGRAYLSRMLFRVCFMKDEVKSTAVAEV